MRYSLADRVVTDLIVVAKQVFTPEIMEPRKPLAPTAGRAGWTGCNILLREVPEAGRITLVETGTPTPKARVREQWDATLFLRERRMDARGWLTLGASPRATVGHAARAERIGAAEFSLAEVYAFGDHLARMFPGNNNVRPKIRQRLQVLRDAGVLAFLGGGRYRRLV